MIDRYVVDFSKTFGGAMLIGIDPKMARADKTNPNSPQEQARDKDGVLKWTVTVSVEIASFGNKKYENIPITVTSREKPLDAILPGTPVTVEGLELGIMPNQRAGFSVFYSAETIRPVQQAQLAPSSNSARAASGQPLQPARPTSGQ